MAESWGSLCRKNGRSQMQHIWCGSGFLATQGSSFTSTDRAPRILASVSAGNVRDTAKAGTGPFGQHQQRKFRAGFEKVGRRHGGSRHPCKTISRHERFEELQFDLT